MNTRRFAKFAFVLAIVALAVGLSGCEKMKTMMPDDMTQMTGGEVSIGIAVALTGEHAEPYGLPMQRGLDLAREEINMLGANITFVPADALSTVEVGRQPFSNWWIKMSLRSLALVSQLISKKFFRLHKLLGWSLLARSPPLLA